MKYITNFFRVGCVALLAMLILAPGAFAQQAPDPPTDLVATATEGTAGSIDLSWEQVPEANNGGFAVTDYIIEVSSDYDAADPTAATWTVLNVTETEPTAPATKYTATHDLSSETPSHNLTRHYRVKAVNVIGEGDPSDVATATTHNVPDAPTDLAAVAGDASDATNPQQARITVTWSPTDAANNGGLAITSYVLQSTATPADDDSWGDVSTQTVADPPATEYSFVHDLSSETPNAGITRHYRVKAVNAASTDGGEYSAAVSGTTHDVPAAPTGLTTGEVAVNAGDNTANDIPVSWNAVPDANNGGLPITGYELQFLLDPPGTTWATATGDVNTVLVVAGKVDTTHAGLAENTTTPETYYYRVRAVSAAGDGDWSSVTAGVKLALPGAPTMLTATAVDQQPAIDLFWMAPENDGEPPVMSYRIERSADYDATSPGSETWDELQASYAGRAYRDRGPTGGFAAGTRYHYRVSAINVVGTSVASNIDGAISSDKALMPRNLVATVATDMESIVLSWDGPVNDEDGNPANGGSPITGYKIEVSTGRRGNLGGCRGR